ncbi:50S ribosomal protein L15 [Candidatus Hodgkinia cicadicola]|nr:50S ribosomal protein L15 [Candidatus Hodgkinia cicadicola]
MPKRGFGRARLTRRAIRAVSLSVLGRRIRRQRINLLNIASAPSLKSLLGIGPKLQLKLLAGKPATPNLNLRCEQSVRRRAQRYWAARRKAIVGHFLEPSSLSLTHTCGANVPENTLAVAVASARVQTGQTSSPNHYSKFGRQPRTLSRETLDVAQV